MISLRLYVSSKNKVPCHTMRSSPARPRFPELSLLNRDPNRRATGIPAKFRTGRGIIFEYHSEQRRNHSLARFYFPCYMIYYKLRRFSYYTIRSSTRIKLNSCIQLIILGQLNKDWSLAESSSHSPNSESQGVYDLKRENQILPKEIWDST
jgi:hypothetical protein